MELISGTELRGNALLRESFMALAKKVFGISFEGWYQNGYWTERYLPYSFVEDGRVIANISVNLTSTIWAGARKNYVQLGTVMTEEAYRHRGLSRKLMERVLSEWESKSDCIYLFANNTVLDFYPKFGFVPEPQYQFKLELCPSQDPPFFEKLDLDRKEGRETLLRCCRRQNPFALLPSVDHFGLLMFYCGSFLKDCVYYSRELDAACVAGQEDGAFVCYDVFGGESASLVQIVSSLAPAGTGEALLGFTPREPEHGRFFPIDPLENDETLFLLKGKENVFAGRKLMFPLLSHA